jgi:hypothetical protein
MYELAWEEDKELPLVAALLHKLWHWLSLMAADPPTELELEEELDGSAASATPEDSSNANTEMVTVFIFLLLCGGWTGIQKRGISR